MTISHEAADTVRIRSTEDLLALIPHQVGRQPRNTSVLFFPVADSSALCLSMNSPTVETDPYELGAELAEVLARVRHCGEVVVTVYSDQALEGGMDREAVAAARWECAVERAGLTVLRALVVGPQHWWDLAEPDRALPVELIRDSAVNAQMIALGSAAEPDAPEHHPRWRHRFARRAQHVTRAWERLRTDDGDSAPARTTVPGPTPPTIDPDPRHPLTAWHRAVRCVQADRQHWVDAVLGLSDGHLALLIEGVHDDLVRDALLYAWLSGSTARAAAALAGLRAAMVRLGGGIAGSEPSQDEIDEALRCVVAVAGEWDGPPDWDTLDGAYRVLQVLDGILGAGRDPLADPTEIVAGSRESLGPRDLSGSRETSGDREPSSDPNPSSDRQPLTAAAASVVATLAQLEVYRGRAHTASRLLARCANREGAAGSERSVMPGRSAAADVAHRLRHQPTPWWCVDRRTAWPGRGVWERGASDQG